MMNAEEKGNPAPKVSFQPDKKPTMAEVMT
jgi:hypothetical protein